MRTGFPTKALGAMAAASLLTGSALAVGPTFTDEIPTVVITDRDSSGVLDVAPGSVLYFRFEDAFAFGDYIDASDYGTNNTSADILFSFAELDGASSVVTSPTISINGDTTVASIPSTEADVLTNSTGDIDDLLDFVNVERNLTSPSTTFTDEADLMVFIAAAPDGVDEFDMASFTVITTNDGSSDSVSAGTGIFTPVTTIETFGGWAPTELDTFATNFNNTTQTGTSPGTITTTPVNPTQGTGQGAAAPNGTETLAIETPSAIAPGIGHVALWDQPIADAIAVGLEDILLVRWNLTTTVAGGVATNGAGHAGMRFRATSRDTGSSESGTRYGGTFDDQLVTRSINLPDGVGVHNSTYYSLLPNNSFSLSFDVLDLSSTAVSDVSLNSIDISVTNRSQLTETVEYNVGNGSFTPAAQPGSPAPAASPTAFVTSGEWGFSNNNNTRPVSNAGSGGTVLVMSSNAPPANSNGLGTWSTSTGAVTATAGNLYILDVWASTNTAGASATTLPDFRLGLQSNSGLSPDTAAAGDSDDPGLRAYGQFGGDKNADVRLLTAPRRYTVVYWPDLRSGLDAVLDVTIDDMLFDASNADQGTLRFDQVTISSAPHGE
ncbi:MAG: hypothetical protein RLY93_17880 [Sumerlaeia bacterium]